MKIVHALPVLAKGGGERIALDLANHASVAGHDVTLIAAQPVDSLLFLDNLHTNVKIRYISKTAHSRFGKYIYLVFWALQNRSWLAEQDILHCHLTYAAVLGMLVRISRLVTGTKGPVVVQTNHSVGAPVHSLRRWLIARMAAQCDGLALIAEDEYWRSFASRNPRIVTQIIFNGISNPADVPIKSAEMYNYRQEIGIPDECSLVVGAIGRLEADRKPWLYLPIFAKIANEFGTKVHFLLGGSGSELERMRSLVIEEKLEGQVHFPGHVIEPRLPLAVMDLYISMNVGAVTGLAGMEAALSEVPVLAVQWIPEYRAAATDWIWSSSDSSEVAKRSCELLKSSLNRLRLAKQQSNYVKLHHTTEAMASSYYALYQATKTKLQESSITEN